MEDQTCRAGGNRSARNAESHLKYAVDAGFLSGAHPNAPDLDDEESNQPASSDSESCDSVGESELPHGLANLAASFRVFSESLLRMERAQLEMAKAREASRLEAEKRRVELEAELTRMLLQTQLQIASFASRQSPSRKRKRVDGNESPPITEREGALLFGLIQCNLLF
ncbi:hypothetical protein SLA2020_445730 [Shorea laevis]